MLEANWTTDLNTTTYQDAINIRFEVFVLEQKVPEDLEIDELEEKSHHVVLYKYETPVGTARIYSLENGVYKVQRVAVPKSFRGQHIGTTLMKEVEQEILRLKGKKATLGAQLHALSFYKDLGYAAEGKEFMDAGIPHRQMTKILDTITE